MAERVLRHDLVFRAAEHEAERRGQPVEVTDKTWYSDDVPVFGIVKRVFTAKTETTSITTETLRKFGRAK